MSVRKFKRPRSGTSASSGRSHKKTGSTVRKFNPPSSARRANTTTSGFMGIEHKFYDTFVTDRAVAAPDTVLMTGGVVDPSASLVVSSPAQGSGPSDRDGKKILIESILITGNIFFPLLQNQTSVFTGNPTVYIALIEDHQSNAASMTSELALVNPSASVHLCASPLKNLLRSTRFTTHKVWTLNPQYMVPVSDVLDRFDTQGQRVPFEMFKKLNIKVNFNGTGVDANIANVSDNSLHVIAFCNFDGYAQINYNCRIRFVG